MVDSVQRAAQPGDAGVQAAAVPADHVPDQTGVVVLPCGEGDPHLIERQVKRAQQLHEPRLRDLIVVVKAVPGRAVDNYRAQQLDLVIVPQRFRRQPAAPGQLTDGQQLVVLLHADHRRTLPRDKLKP